MLRLLFPAYRIETIYVFHYLRVTLLSQTIPYEITHKRLTAVGALCPFISTDALSPTWLANDTRRAASAHVDFTFYQFEAVRALALYTLFHAIIFKITLQ